MAQRWSSTRNLGFNRALRGGWHSSSGCNRRSGHCWAVWCCAVTLAQMSQHGDLIRKACPMPAVATSRSGSLSALSVTSSPDWVSPMIRQLSHHVTCHSTCLLPSRSRSRLHALPCAHAHGPCQHARLMQFVLFPRSDAQSLSPCTFLLAPACYSMLHRPHRYRRLLLSVTA